MFNRKIEFVLVSAFVFACLQSHAIAETWSTEIASVCTILPADIATAVDSDGYVHIAYIDNSRAKYATNRSGSWISTNIDTNNVGNCIAIALDANDKVHIATLRSDVSHLGEYMVFYSTNASGIWHSQDVTTHYYFSPNSMAIGVTSTGIIYIAYANTDTLGGDMDLYVSYGSWGSWSSSTVDDTAGTHGAECAMAIDSLDKVHLAYISSNSAGWTSLRYATNSSGSWGGYATVRYDPDWDVQWPGIAVDSYLAVHISFGEMSNSPGNDSILRYANNNSGSWVIETVDSSYNVGYYTSIAVTEDGTSRISYFDAWTKHLKYASNAQGSWFTQAVADANDNSGTSIALSPSYDVHIGFRRAWSHVEHAYTAALTPAPPSNCNALLLPGQIHVTWNDNSSNETGFVLYYRQSPGLGGWSVVNLGPNVTSYQLHNATHNFTYSFRVCSVNGYGRSAFSSDSVYYGYLLFSLSLDSPDGNEILPAGYLHNITWTNGFSPPSTVTIDYSIDGGSHWQTPPIATAVTNTGSYPWLVPFTESNDCIVRIRDSADGDPYDLSYNPFTILIDDINIMGADSNVTAWFGGDDRPGWTRNLGYAQSIKFGRSAHITNVAFKFNSYFDYAQNPDGHGHSLYLFLRVRTADGAIIGVGQTFVPESFNGGWINFDLSTDVFAMRDYIFTCHMKDGETLKYSNGICARTDNPWPYSTGYVANVTTPPYDMDDWSNWDVHPWDFNFWIRGYYNDICHADFDKNRWTDLYDLDTFADQWLHDDCVPIYWCNKTDLDFSGDVDFRDFADMGSCWKKLDYGSIDACDISAMSGQLSSGIIYGSDDNDFWPGTWFIYRTGTGGYRYGKMIVEALDKTQNNQLTLGWTTYNSDGSIYSRGTGLVVRGTYYCDLDEGLETVTGADFQWRIVSSSVRYLEPRDNALFKLMYRAK
jgi:hypothetical protein